jgi:ribonucleoside-diphosphate reductase subunit M1
MRVIKRDSQSEDVSFDKVLRRIQTLSDGLCVDACEVAKNVCARIYDGVRTSELDELAAHMCSSLMTEHPDYGVLASRIIISNHHKNTSPSFSETVQQLRDNRDAGGVPFPLVGQELCDVVALHRDKINNYIDYSRDYAFDYFGFKTLERGYLMRVADRVVERPQHMLMRVALGIHGADIKDALATYDLMSKKYFVHATPTLFNAGTPRPQNSSCYLVHMSDDSIAGIYETLSDCAAISKYAGGIGMHVHNIRARNSVIRGTNGQSTGLVPMLRVFDATAR